MIATKSPTYSDTDEKGAPLNYFEVLRNRLGTFCMYGKGILKDIQDFGYRMESKASIIANDLNQNTIQIELSSDDIVENQNSDGGKYGTGKFEEFLKAQRKGSVKCLVRHIRR